MSIMEYAKNSNPNDEVIEDKGVKVLLILVQLCIYSEQKWIIK